LSAEDLLDDGTKKIVDEVRSEQVHMAQKVEDAIRSNTNLIAEAGTGIGKSFAVLIPAILSGRRTIVSTATTLLQHQYDKFALDFLATKLEGTVDFTYAVAKGKGHYLCPKLLLKSHKKLKPRGGFKTAKQREVHDAFMEWARETPTGDKEDLDEALKPLGAITPEYFSDVSAEECTGAKGCAMKDKCGYVKSRVAIQNAKIIIANHMLVGLNAKLGGKVLPKHEIYIMDEAHKAEEYFRKAFGSTLRETTLSRLIDKVDAAFAADPVGTDYLHDLTELDRSLFFCAAQAHTGDSGQTVTATELFEADLKGIAIVLGKVQERINWLLDGMGGGNDQEDEDFINDLGVDAETRIHYTNARGITAASDEESFGEVDEASLLNGPELRNVLAKVGRAAENIATLLDTDAGSVLYVEKFYTKKGEPRHTLVRAPVMLGNLLRRNLYPLSQVIIQTSATLSIGGDFNFYKEEMGLDDNTTTFVAPSPFDYRGRTMLYLPRHLPMHPNNQWPRHPDPVVAMEEYSEAIAVEITRLIRISKGCAFVLFSARSEMEEMYRRVKERVKFPCRIQEPGVSTGSLETWFKEEKQPVLFATKSFWEGISVEGKQLRMVIIPKVPFPSPADPIMEEKKNIVSERHGSKAWFMRLYFPVMVMDVLQGLGRLMRRQDDFGVAAILDTRVIPGAAGSKRYGKQLISSLPFTNATHDIERIRMTMENMERGMGPF